MFYTMHLYFFHLCLRLRIQTIQQNNVISNKEVKVLKHQSRELFRINSNVFKYLKITKTKFSHVRHSTWMQTVHFRESKHVVCVPTRLTHISLKTNADIREHAAKGKCQLRRFVGCHGLDCQTQFLLAPTYCMYATCISLSPQGSNFTEKETGILQDRDDNFPNQKQHSSWNR